MAIGLGLAGETRYAEHIVTSEVLNGAHSLFYAIPPESAATAVTYLTRKTKDGTHGAGRRLWGAVLSCMWSPFPGFSGMVLGALYFVCIFAFSYREHKHGPFDLDPRRSPSSPCRGFLRLRGAVSFLPSFLAFPVVSLGTLKSAIISRSKFLSASGPSVYSGVFIE